MNRKIVGIILFFLFLASPQFTFSQQKTSEDAWLFAYFTNKNNNKNGLHLAWSEDGYNWKSIGDEYSFLRNDYGNWSTEKKLRDPFVMLGKDGRYHLLWTINWNIDIIGHASTTDFIHWSRQDYIPVMNGFEVRNTWASEMIYDDENKQYIIYWASTIKENGVWKTEQGKDYDNRMYYTTTKDFKSFTPAKIFFDPGHNVIDATIEKKGDTYYMIYKDETEVPKPHKNLLVATSKNAEGSYKRVSEKTFSPDWVEGPAVVSLNDGSYLVYMDSYRQNKYLAQRTFDFKTFEDVSDKITMPRDARHGSFVKVSKSFVDTLIATQQRIAQQRLDDSGGIPPVFPSKPVMANWKINARDSNPISNTLIGVFFEDINYAADGGLYAELVQNRGFEYAMGDVAGRDSTWNATKAWEFNSSEPDGKFEIRTENPIHPNNPHYASIAVLRNNRNVRLINNGFDGIPVKAGEKYDFSFFVRSPSIKQVAVQLIGEDNTVIGETMVRNIGASWKKIELVLTANKTDEDARLAIVLNRNGIINVDMVSLFPQKTFKNRKNGLRADLAQAIADIKPKFMRFPGGCLVHGDGLENMYRWKNTVGPLESRVPQRNIWNYHQTAGLGYFEYFQFCEDIGAEPVPVVPAGVCCQNSRHRGQEGLPMCDMHDYAREVIDLVEFANGDATTKWGKVRAEMGHPKPFNLKYVGVGNEDLISDIFEERFRLIYNVMKEAHPEITVIGTVGPFHDGTDYTEGWKIANDMYLEMVDEHYYENPNWFINHQDFYDKYERNATKVYLGEYASRGNTLFNALAEAAYMTALERNGDVVHMASYAPLLARDGHTQWNPDLIYFNKTEVKPTINYYVQKLFGTHAGETYFNSTLALSDTTLTVQRRVAVSAVEDKTTGDVILKCVNILPVEVILKPNFVNFDDFEPAAEKIILSGSLDSKTAKPQLTTVPFSPFATLRLEPNSLTVIQLKKK